MDKDEIFKHLLENQKNFTNKKPLEKIDDIEPFSWMDENIKQHLEENISSDDMKKFDEIARANFIGQRTMLRALKNALSKSNEREES